MPGHNIAPYKRLQRVLPCKCNYTTHTAKQRTGLYRGFSCDCTRSTAHNNSPIQAAIIPPATRWRAYTRPDALSLYQIPPPRRDAGQVRTGAYYNKVYKRADHASPAGQLLPYAERWQVLTRCQQHRPDAPAEGVSTSTCTGSARRLASCARSSVRTHQLVPSTRRGSPAATARNHWRLPPQLFSGYRPIANRSQQ